MCLFTGSYPLWCPVLKGRGLAEIEIERFGISSHSNQTFSPFANFRKRRRVRSTLPSNRYYLYPPTLPPTFLFPPAQSPSSTPASNLSSPPLHFHYPAHYPTCPPTLRSPSTAPATLKANPSTPPSATPKYEHLRMRASFSRYRY